MINEKETTKTGNNEEQVTPKAAASFLKNPNNNTKQDEMEQGLEQLKPLTIKKRLDFEQQKAATIMSFNTEEPSSPPSSAIQVAEGVTQASKPRRSTIQSNVKKPKPIGDAVSSPKIITPPPVETAPKIITPPKEATQSKRTPKPHQATLQVGEAVKKATAAPRKTTAKKGSVQPVLKIIPLGGLNEIGKNMTLYECQGDMLIIDCGLAFPDADMLGVDIVIPDFTFVEKNLDKIKGICITHGHEDHIGSIPYLLKKYDLPIYASPLALGLIKGKLKEHGLLNKAKLFVALPRQKVEMGCMTVEFIGVNHSIPDAMSVAIHTPAGVVIQTGDFKVDYSPIEGEIIDLARFAELGNEGVLCLLSDSTNAERPGSTVSERKVGQSFQALFSNAEGKRIIIASFASNIHRVQQIINVAEKFGRKVAVSGRSMENVVAVAIELGYLNVPKGILIDIDAVSSYTKDKIIIITTGSQGEPMSALSRMAIGEHRKVSVTTDDLIIISATPIPGNEKHVTRVVNDLLKLGAEVVYEAMYEVHVSGHACQDELKLMLALTKPKFFMPVHGEFKHLKAHSKLAIAMGVLPQNIHIGDIGQVIEFTPDTMKMESTVESGRVLVDGLGVGDVGAIVLRDRRHLAQDGLIIVVITMESASGALLSGPDIVSRGFVYVRESEPLIADAKIVVRNILDTCAQEGIRDWSTIKINVRDGLSNFIYRKTKRGPMILPIISEV